MACIQCILTKLVICNRYNSILMYVYVLEYNQNEIYLLVMYSLMILLSFTVSQCEKVIYLIICNFPIV